ncbi:hypothetical protein D1818_18210 [Aquimarina sp. BL5]|uniref:hypothetical protein n=1 Tax=Aquimarina sp. BL5 TaxID=1714860 RepID=UPI000E552945|nr:hypothetical protein [Aquimarina sp. BL5]AXT52672.1 hypothetical protein D1818_18210 [Aquimarina sp. BL5]RKN11736.1 hypothetical protein D7036_00910 [Aquimarina sp. BL5]
MKKLYWIFGIINTILIALGAYFYYNVHMVEKGASKESMDELYDYSAALQEAKDNEKNYSETIAHYFTDIEDWDLYRALEIEKRNGPRFQETGAPQSLVELYKSRGEMTFYKSILGYELFHDRTKIDTSDFSLHNFVNILIVYQNLDTPEGIMRTVIKKQMDTLRNPIHLRNAFEKHKTEFLDYIPKSFYQKVFKKQVTELLESYDFINGIEDQESYFDELLSKADETHTHYEIWDKTFWYRRELENNKEEVYNILLEIEQYYKEDQ